MQAIASSITSRVGRMERDPAPEVEPSSEAQPKCFHCGTTCSGAVITRHEKAFCCHGCLTVFELLAENGLADFYELSETAGVRVQGAAKLEQFKFLDEPAVREKLIDFADERITRVTFRVPAIHCIACVWLLENLFRLKAGIGRTQVHFPRKEVSITFENAKLQLSDVATLLASLGYEPELKFSDLESRPEDRANRRLWLQLGVAGFAFGNTMLLSISSYVGLDTLNGAALRDMFGWISLILALPVFFYSAADYWRSAWLSLRQRLLTIDVPIAAGIAALFAQSTFEVLTARGEGYFDSLAGLLFFLLCGKLFRQKTYDRLAFDRDYKSFFPLSVTRKKRGQGLNTENPTLATDMRGVAQAAEERVALAQLHVGDHLIIRNGEIIPADACLVEGRAVVDYSFVTGESEPVRRIKGDCLYAGGRQLGGAIEVEMVKPVSQSYLTSLWSQEAFRKERGESLDTLTNRYSRRFTKIVIGIAVGAAVFWAFREPTLSLPSFTSVLIVACPCALALAAPFALGTAQRVLARRNVFLKCPGVLEALARIETIVFDKTGTLTASGAGSVAFHGAALGEAEQRWLYSLTRHSMHPHAVRIGEALAGQQFTEPVRSFAETTGGGMEGSVSGHEIRMGSATWLGSQGVALPETREDRDEFELADAFVSLTPALSQGERLPSSQTSCFEPLNLVGRVRPGEPNVRHTYWGGSPGRTRPAVRFMGREPESALSALSPEVRGKEPLVNRSASLSAGSPHADSSARIGSVVHVAIDGWYRGCFVLANALRPSMDKLIADLSPSYELALLSGDNERDGERFRELFGQSPDLRFNQSPANKLEFIRQLRQAGRRVMMVGDGLNDAGALKQSDVGVAVVEDIGAFSPASDVIVTASMVPRLDAVLRFAKEAVRVVRASFLISAVYNVAGIAIAARGLLSPVVCAILMPLSSVTVVAFACGVTGWLGRKIEANEAVAKNRRSSVEAPP